ncbi:MAG: TMEM43 family protein [Desulfovibrio sp.]|nr:TMEM43 family protein [Desulfovibrio sp.]
MDYSETTTTSWFSRLGSSLIGIGTGILLILGGTAFLWWNEGDFVKTKDALYEVQGAASEMRKTDHVDAALNGKLVHAKALATTEDVLRDPIFGIGDKAIAFSRDVEFYQWKETSKREKRQKLGGGEETTTTYSYKQDWMSHPVDVQQFHSPDARTQYNNSVLMTIEDLTLYAKNVHFGAYRLPDFLISSMPGAVPYSVSLQAATRDKLNRTIIRNRPNLLSGVNVDTVSSNRLPMLLHEQGATLYIGSSPATPQVGDVRVRFTKTPPAFISIVAKVKGDTFEKYKASNGKEISILALGDVSLEQMVGEEQSENKMITWVFRLLGCIIVIVGFRCVLKPLAVTASVVPLLGNIMDVGLNLVSFLLGVAWSLVIIAIAWLFYRPLVGGLLVVVAIGLFVMTVVKGKKKEIPA